MSSTHNRATLLAAMTFALVPLAGCERNQPPHPQVAKLNPEPLTDKPTEMRDWDKTVVTYPSGATPAFSTRQRWRMRDDSPQVLRTFGEPVTFFAQVPLLPLTFLRTPPGHQRAYHGIVIPASYTAQPYLPGMGEDPQAKSDWGSRQVFPGEHDYPGYDPTEPRVPLPKRTWPWQRTRPAPAAPVQAPAAPTQEPTPEMAPPVIENPPAIQEVSPTETQPEPVAPEAGLDETAPQTTPPLQEPAIEPAAPTTDAAPAPVE